MVKQKRRTSSRQPLVDLRTEEGRRRLGVALVRTIVVGAVFQGMTMARNNYSLWRLEFSALELVVGFAGALVAGMLWTPAKAARGQAWARSYVPSEEGPLWNVLHRLPEAAFVAAIMTAFLSVVNVGVVTPFIYREDVVLPPLAMIVRFLADIPAGLIVCLVVPMVLDSLQFRRQERAEARAKTKATTKTA